MQHLTSHNMEVVYFLQEKRTCALCKEEFKASQAMKRHLMVAHHRVVRVYTFSSMHFTFLRGFTKLDKFKKYKNNWMDLIPPNPKFFFLNPSLTWTEYSNHNDCQPLITYLQTILGRFSKFVFRVRLGPTHPLPQLSRFLFCSTLQSP